MLDKFQKLVQSNGELKPGEGLASGVMAIILAGLCFLGVLAFHLHLNWGEIS